MSRRIAVVLPEPKLPVMTWARVTAALFILDYPCATIVRSGCCHAREHGSARPKAGLGPTVMSICSIGTKVALIILYCTGSPYALAVAQISQDLSGRGEAAKLQSRGRGIVRHTLRREPSDQGARG